MNRTSVWKYLLLALVVITGFIYAVPNLYGEDPALQLTRGAELPMDDNAADFVARTLADKEIEYKTLVDEGNRVMVRFADTDTQREAADELRRKVNRLGDRYVVALTLASRNPPVLSSFGATPMGLGLDLRGGVHFLMEVDLDAAMDQARRRFSQGVRRELRQEKISYRYLKDGGGVITVKLRQLDDLPKAEKRLRKKYPELTYSIDEATGQIQATLLEESIEELKERALQQNLITLRNRVNELGVAEPVVQRQGASRIIVQLPGVQDPALAKTIIGSTATLEYRLVAEQGEAGSQRYTHREGYPVFLKPEVIATGANLVDASAGIDSQNPGAVVHVTLDSEGGRRMLDTTKQNVGKPMAVLFIEDRYEPIYKKDGTVTQRKLHIEEVISVANIQGVFSNRFQTSGLETNESVTLALLLRSGALAAPVYIVEERTIGPSLGQDNIDQGMEAVVIGFTLVVFFMLFYYRGFGLVANMALALNLVLIIAVLSITPAALTLPGIAGIVLTVGMAVDANVLIFERIREELRDGAMPQSAINGGYDKAFWTILDANVTTLIAAIVLFSLGSGPIRGFAVTLGIGILTSMFTAIFGTRAIVNLFWGGRDLKKLPI